MRGALAGLIALWLIWGLNWPLWRLILLDSGPLEFIALRTVVAAALLVLLMVAWRRSLMPRPFWPLFLIGMTQGVGMNGFSVVAVADSGATKAAIFAYTMPLWTVLFAYLVLHEQIRARQWLAIALGASGLGIVIAAHSTAISALGALLATCGGLLWAIGTVAWKWTTQRENVDAFLMITWQNVFAVMPLGIAALLVHERPMHWDGLLIFAFVYNVAITAVLAWLLWFWVVRRLPAATAGMTAFAIPVVAIVGAYLFAGERPEPLQWAGILAMLAALALVTLPSSEPSASSETSGSLGRI